jgi:hypothetical protein
MIRYMVVVLLAGCAAAPPQPPPPPLTREDLITQAVVAATLAGHDGQATYDRLHLYWCLQDAQQLDQSQRSTAIARCRVDWPQKPDITISSR